MTDLPGLRVPPGLSGALRYIAVGMPALVSCVVHITTSFPHVCLASIFVVFPVAAQTLSRLDGLIGSLGAALHRFHWFWLRFMILAIRFSNGPLIIIQRKSSVLRARSFLLPSFV